VVESRADCTLRACFVCEEQARCIIAPLPHRRIAPHHTDLHEHAS
jgi:hypothetical protein